MKATFESLFLLVVFMASIWITSQSYSSPLPSDINTLAKHNNTSNDFEKFYFIRSMILNGSDDLPVADPPLVQINFLENATNNQNITQIRLAKTHHPQSNISFVTALAAKQAQQIKKVEFLLLNNQDEFAIDQDSGLIKLIRTPLTNYCYVLDVNIVKTSLNSGKQLSTKVPVLIDIIDVNREPEPLKSLYSCLAYDNLKSDIPVCTISFRDEGRAKNSMLLYSMNPSEEGINSTFFKIDEETGSIFKQTSSLKPGDYSFVVTATDHGTPNLEGSVLVKVTIYNSSKVLSRVNDNTAPKFKENLSSVVTLTENHKMGEKLIDFTVTDPDSDPTPLFIVRGDPGGLFDVDASSLYLVKNPDFSEERVYNLTIMTTDSAYEAVTHVLVKSPRIIRELPNTVFNHNVTLEEGPITIPSSVIDISSNAFELKFAKFTLFSASSIEAKEAFTIEECCGLVKQTKALDYELNHKHELIFQIEDTRLNKNYYRSFAKVTIHVSDINDWRPNFTIDNIEVEIPENISLFQHFYQVKATDFDSGRNGVVTYAITSGNQDEIFCIDPYQGQVYVNKSLDPFLEGPSIDLDRDIATGVDYFPLVITASDEGQSYKLTSNFSLGIRITIPSDVPPRFLEKSHEIQVREDEKVGSIIHVFHAKSKHPLKYDISYGNDDNYFTIGKHDGKLMIQKRLNFNIKSQHDLAIKATLSRPSKRIIKLGLSNDTTILRIIITPKPVVLSELPKTNILITTPTDQVPFNPGRDPINENVNPNQQNFGHNTPRNQNPMQPGGEVHTRPPFPESYVSLKALTSIVIGFMALLFIVACFCLLCRCCCRSNKTKRYRNKNGNLLNRSYNSHQRLHSHHSQIGDFNNSMSRSMNSRLSLRANSNLHTPTNVKANHSKYNAGDSVSLTAINERKSRPLLLPHSPMTSRDKTSTTDQEDENFYANAFGPGHPQYLSQLRRLKPDGTRLSTRLSSKKPASSVNIHNDNRSYDLNNLQSRFSSQLPRTSIRSSSRFPSSSRNSRNSNNLQPPARQRKDLNGSRTTNTSTNVSPSLNDNSSRTVLLSDNSVSHKNINPKIYSANKNNSLADYDEVASRSTMLDTSPQSSSSDSDSGSELPLESRYLTFVRKKTKNASIKARENSERLIITSEDTDNGPNTELLRDHNNSHGVAGDERVQKDQNGEQNGNGTYNGRSRVGQSVSQNNSEEGEEEEEQADDAQEEDENERGNDDDDDGDEEDGNDEEEDDDDDDDEDDDEEDEQEGDEVGIYDLNGGNVVTGSIQRNSYKHNNILDSSQSDQNQSTNSVNQETSKLIKRQHRPLSDNQSHNSNSNGSNNNNNNIIVSDAITNNSRSRSRALDALCHRKEPDDL